MMPGLHSWLAPAVGKVPVGGMMKSASLGHHLRAWSWRSASNYLRNFIVWPSLDISDVPGLLPCA
jgi:hypothetical protein